MAGAFGQRGAALGHPARPRPAWRSPIALLTGGVLLVAILAVGAIQLLPGSGHSAAAQPGTRTAAGILVPLITTPTTAAEGRSLGPANAPAHLTVWSDFQCPACRTFATGNEMRLITDFVNSGRLRIDYRDLVIIGPESQAAATAARCADDQGKFWLYHDVLYANVTAENSGYITAQRLKDMADAVGLDRGKFDSCLVSTDVLSAVERESAIGHTRGNSTPTLDFGVDVIAGSPAYDQLKAKIDGIIAAAAPGGSPAASAGGSAPAASGSGSPAPSAT